MRQSPRTEPEGREKEEDLSHIHVPDGVLPLWLVAVGWLATALVLALCLRRVPADDWTRRLPLLGVIAALMVVGMTVEIVPIGYHLNLTVVAGIVLGPALGFIAAFIVNAILAMFGHSGVTVIGLNTLVIGSEVAVGYLLFRALLGVLSCRRVAWAAGGATLLALMVSSLLMVALVALANVGLAAPAAASPEPLGVRNPFANGLLVWEIFPDAEVAAPVLDVGTFARLVLALGSIGWLIETAISGLIVAYAGRVRPDIVLPGVAPRPPIADLERGA